MNGGKRGRDTGPNPVLDQDQQNAEYILEEIMGRHRYPVETRDKLAAALCQVGAGIPLRKRRAPKGNRR